MKHLLLTTIAAVVLVGCGPPEPPDISIHKAVSKENVGAIKQHLAAGTDVNAKDDSLGWTPLHYAATLGNRQITKLLISKGADVNAINDVNQTPLDIAALIVGIETTKQRSNLTQTADLLRKHSGKTAEELKAEGN